MELSSTLKSLIDRADPCPVAIPASPKAWDAFSKIEQEASAKKLSIWSWLAIITATTMTMNSPESMAALFRYTTAPKPLSESTLIAEFMREIGLRCIGINGIPRSINMLAAFRASLPSHVVSSLDTSPSRYLSVPNADPATSPGRTLWKQLHHPLHAKLEGRLRKGHPDLPGVIIDRIYGDIFANPGNNAGVKIDRVTMSLCTIACLRAQPGVGPQLLGHVRGLKKIWADDSWRSGSDTHEEETIAWLSSDEGCIWVLKTVDELVTALGGHQGRSFLSDKAKI